MTESFLRIVMILKIAELKILKGFSFTKRYFLNYLFVSRRKNEKYLGFGSSSGTGQGRRAAAQASQAEGSMSDDVADQLERDRLVNL